MTQLAMRPGVIPSAVAVLMGEEELPDGPGGEKENRTRPCPIRLSGSGSGILYQIGHKALGLVVDLARSISPLISSELDELLLDAYDLRQKAVKQGVADDILGSSLLREGDIYLEKARNISKGPTERMTFADAARMKYQSSMNVMKPE